MLLLQQRREATRYKFFAFISSFCGSPRNSRFCAWNLRGSQKGILVNQSQNAVNPFYSHTLPRKLHRKITRNTDQIVLLYLTDVSCFICRRGKVTFETSQEKNVSKYL